MPFERKKPKHTQVSLTLISPILLLFPLQKTENTRDTGSATSQIKQIKCSVTQKHSNQINRDVPAFSLHPISLLMTCLFYLIDCLFVFETSWTQNWVKYRSEISDVTDATERKIAMRRLGFHTGFLARVVCLCCERLHRWKAMKSSTQEKDSQGGAKRQKEERERDEGLRFELKWNRWKALDGCLRGQSRDLIRQRFPMRLLHAVIVGPRIPTMERERSAVEVWESE